MNNNTLDLDTPVSIMETSRAMFANIDKNVNHSKILIDDTDKMEVISTKKNDCNVNTNDIAIEIKDTQDVVDIDNLYYVLKNEFSNDSTIYNIDNKGNLLSKINMNEISKEIKLEDGKTVVDKDTLIDIVKKAKEEINFLEKQNELKEVIKGYSEHSELWLKNFNCKETSIRFSNERNLLKTMLSNNSNDFKILASIYAKKGADYLLELIDDKVINSRYFPLRDNLSLELFQILNKVYSNYEHKVILKFPSFKEIIESNFKLTYSNEFFNDYLMNDEDIDILVNQRYLKLREIYLGDLVVSLKNNLNTKVFKTENILKKLLEIEIKCTSPIEDDLFDNLKSSILKNNDELILPSGIKALDNNNAFIKKGKITSIFAYTGNYKTMCCTNISYENISKEKNVVYISLEISKEEMYVNLLSRHSYNFDKPISHSDIKMNKITDEDIEYLFNDIHSNFKEKLKSHFIIYDETDITSNSYTTYSKLLANADKKFIKKTGHGIDLLIIDHINLLKFDLEEKSCNDYSAINHWMNFFRKNSVNFLDTNRKIATICACQSSRQGYEKAEKNGFYSLTGIAESNEIERSSQLVMSIYVDDYCRENNLAKMQILKSRDSQPTTDSIIVEVEPKYYVYGLEVKEEKNKTMEDKYSNYKNDLSSFEINN